PTALPLRPTTPKAPTPSGSGSAAPKSAASKPPARRKSATPRKPSGAAAGVGVRRWPRQPAGPPRSWTRTAAPVTGRPVSSAAAASPTGPPAGPRPTPRQAIPGGWIGRALVQAVGQVNGDLFSELVERFCA